MSLPIPQVELKVEAINVISRADALPFEVIDASRGDEEVAAAAAKGEALVTVNRDTRLDSRPIDLRTPANQAVFQIQSGVCQVQRGVNSSAPAALLSTSSNRALRGQLAVFRLRSAAAEQSDDRSGSPIHKLCYAIDSAHSRSHTCTWTRDYRPDHCHDSVSDTAAAFPGDPAVGGLPGDPHAQIDRGRQRGRRRRLPP